MGVSLSLGLIPHRGAQLVTMDALQPTTQEVVMLVVAIAGIVSLTKLFLTVTSNVLALPYTLVMVLLKTVLKLVVFIIKLPGRILMNCLWIPKFVFLILHATLIALLSITRYIVYCFTPNYFRRRRR